MAEDMCEELGIRGRKREMIHIAAHLHDILGSSRQLKEISKIVLHHHEKWDGTGYPMGIKEKEIPVGSRIIAICDAIDAMTSKRAYKNSMSWDNCRMEIEKNLGIMFDPNFGKVALGLIPIWSQELKYSKESI